MVDNLHTDLGWLCRLPACGDRNLGPQGSLHSIHLGGTADRRHRLVHRLLPEDIRAVDEVHCLA